MSNYYPDPDNLDEPDALLEDDLAHIGAYDFRNRHGSSLTLGAAVINWRTLEPEDAPAAWRSLRAFVEWFTTRYNIPVSTVPTCWWQHGQLVEELSALHTAHTVSYDDADTGYGPISWHERLTGALPRLTRAYGGGCNNGHHDLTPRNWDGVTDEGAWTAWTTRSHAHRDTHPGDSPRKETP
jgi:hypothetical protein